MAENLDRPQDLGQISEYVKDGRINGKDAAEHNVPSSHPQPPPQPCPYCNKTLYHEGVYLWGNIICWSPSPERCDCAEAKTYWEVEDARVAAQKAEEARLAKQKAAQERYEKLLGKSGMGKRFLQRTFDTYECDTQEQHRAFIVAKRFAETFKERLEDGRGLYIEGTNGTGKTHLAAAISLQLMREYYTVIFRTYGDLLDEVKRTYDREGGTTEYELSQLYRNCDLLIIDDLGKEQCTDWSVSFLYGVINDRYEGMLPTIVTTNYDAEGLIKALTPNATGDNQKAKAIVSRLHETSVVLTMAWEDHRTPKRKAGGENGKPQS